MDKFGSKVEIDDIDHELHQLWKDNETMTRASLFNLCIYNESLSSADANCEMIPQITKEHACRVLLIFADHKVEEISAWINAHCQISKAGSSPVCSEQITFTLPCLEAKSLLRSVVFAHLESDLPLYFWWQEDFTENFSSYLHTRIDRLIFDSNSWATPNEQFVKILSSLENSSHRFLLADFSWMQTKSLRNSIRNTFSEELVFADLEKIESIRSINCNNNEMANKLFVAWFAQKLGYKYFSKSKNKIFFRNDETKIFHVVFEKTSPQGADKQPLLIVNCQNATYEFYQENNGASITAHRKNNLGNDEIINKTTTKLDDSIDESIQATQAELKEYEQLLNYHKKYFTIQDIVTDKSEKISPTNILGSSSTKKPSSHSNTTANTWLLPFITIPDKAIEPKSAPTSTAPTSAEDNSSSKTEQGLLRFAGIFALLLISLLLVWPIISLSSSKEKKEAQSQKTIPTENKSNKSKQKLAEKTKKTPSEAKPKSTTKPDKPIKQASKKKKEKTDKQQPAEKTIEKKKTDPDIWTNPFWSPHRTPESPLTSKYDKAIDADDKSTTKTTSSSDTKNKVKEPTVKLPKKINEPPSSNLVEGMKKEFKIKLKLPGNNKPQFRFGEPIPISISSDRDCFFALYVQDSSGNISRIFPTSNRNDNFIFAHDIVPIIARKDEKTPANTSLLDPLLQAGKPAGIDTIYAIASTDINIPIPPQLKGTKLDNSTELAKSPHYIPKKQKQSSHTYLRIHVIPNTDTATEKK